MPRFELHHVGIVVPDLEKAIHFYENAFGMHVLSREADTDVNPHALGIAADDVRLRGAILEAGGAHLELHEYLTPTGQASRNVYELGIGHIAFAVEDIHTAFAYLQSLGVRFNTQPQLIIEGVLAGRWWVYGTDPWGNVFELGQSPRQPAA
ncbi:VOC family protein [Microbacterium sp. X-17]|uniref:VOC family protein n=1 Tax=Microbacterium sp. X-17 TaxID=3144404 RepID=UPI0031F4B748